jgi:hypothetical protein
MNRQQQHAVIWRCIIIERIEPAEPIAPMIDVTPARTLGAWLGTVATVGACGSSLGGWSWRCSDKSPHPHRDMIRVGKRGGARRYTKMTSMVSMRVHSL